MNNFAPYRSRIIIMASLVLVLLSSSIAWAGVKKSTFPDVEYAYAKAYLFNIESDSIKDKIYGQSGWASTKIGDGELIPKDQLKTLHRAVNRDPDVLLMGLAKCFIPRHGIVYFDQKDQPVAALSICFQCQGMRFFPEPKDEQRFRSRIGQNRVRKAQKDLKAMEMVITDIGLPVSENLQEYADFVSARRSRQTAEDVITVIDDEWVRKTIGDAPNLAFFQGLMGDDIQLKAATGETKGQFFAEGVVLTVKAADESLMAASIRNPKAKIQGIKTGLSIDELRRLTPSFSTEKMPRTLVIRSAKTGYAVSLKMKETTLDEIRIEWVKPPVNAPATIQLKPIEKTSQPKHNSIP